MKLLIPFPYTFCARACLRKPEEDAAPAPRERSSILKSIVRIGGIVYWAAARCIHDHSVFALLARSCCCLMGWYWHRRVPQLQASTTWILIIHYYCCYCYVYDFCASFAALVCLAVAFVCNDCLRVDTAFQQSYTFVLYFFTRRTRSFFSQLAFTASVASNHVLCRCKLYVYGFWCCEQNKQFFFLLFQIGTKTRNSTTPASMSRWHICLFAYATVFIWHFRQLLRAPFIPSTWWNFIWIRCQRHMSLLFIYFYFFFALSSSDWMFARRFMHNTWL